MKYARPTNGQARVKYIICDWKVGDVKYKGEFFFDEEEIMKVFSGSWNNNGELVIKVSKYNNLFDISLIKGADKQSLKKTKIHVFRDTPSKLKKTKSLSTIIIGIFILGTFILLENSIRKKFM